MESSRTSGVVAHWRSRPAPELTLDQDDLTTQVARVLVEMQRQVLVTQKVQRTVEVPLVQYIDSRVEVPVVKEYQIPTTPTEQKTVLFFCVSTLGKIAAPNARTLVLIRRFSSCQ